MISVCLPTYNGEAYILSQINSILSQLSSDDEIVVFDDCSVDSTVKLIESLMDPRIKLFKNKENLNYVKNFEMCLFHAKGDYIYLSDQDDVWLDNKIDIMQHYLKFYDLVVSDCFVTDANLEVLFQSYHKVRRSNKNKFLDLLLGSPYLGCCMAFKRNVLDVVLPFPDMVESHDIWIGNVSAFFFNTLFIPDKLILYRRHDFNISTFAGTSKNSYLFRLKKRILLIRQLLSRKSKISNS